MDTIFVSKLALGVGLCFRLGFRFDRFLDAIALLGTELSDSGTGLGLGADVVVPRLLVEFLEIALRFALVKLPLAQAGDRSELRRRVSG